MTIHFYNNYQTPKGEFNKVNDLLVANKISRSAFYRKLKKDPTNWYVIKNSTSLCKGCDIEFDVNVKKAGYCSNKCRGLHLNYGISLKVFDNLLFTQKNRCYICSLNFSKTEKNKLAHVDHCHKTGRVRGLLCSNCNRGIGLLQDNHNFFYQAIKYLTNDQMKIAKLRDVKTPIRSTDGSAGLDFFIPNDFINIILSPGMDVNIPSGIKADIPLGFMLCAFNKSGIALKGLDVGASVIDSDYTGEIHLHVRNISTKDVAIESGQKLIQFILMPVSLATIEEVDESDLFIDKQTQRGEGGFGSTGLK